MGHLIRFIAAVVLRKALHLAGSEYVSAEVMKMWNGTR